MYLAFYWHIGHTFQNPILLTSSLILNIAPEKQVWYKLCLGFVITKVMVFGIGESDLASVIESSQSLNAFCFLWETH